MLVSIVKNFEEPIVQAMCWTDPYAVLTVANNSYYQRRSIILRIVGDLFFDQQARSFFHSSDILSFVLLVVLFHVKLDLIKQESSRNNDM